MKSRIIAKYGVLVLFLAALFILSSCTSVVDSIGKIDSAVSRTKAKAGQAVMDAAGIGAMEDAMLASIVYAQVFFAGGYMYGYEDMREGQGVVWQLTSSDESGTQSIEIERALLKKNDDGTAWWLLKYTDPGQEPFVSEALLDENYGIVKFRYRDQETGDIREWVPEQAEEQAAEAESGEEEEGMAYAGQEALYRGDYEDYIVDTEKVTTDFGTYPSEHVLIEDSYTIYTDEEQSEENAETYEVSYEWWIVKQIPGDIMKYEWKNITEGISLKGELISIKTDYTTQLESF
jgi:hypothetical protein